MNKKQSVSFLLLFCILFSSIIPIFGIEAKAAENNYVINLVDQDGKAIEDEIIIKCKEEGFYKDSISEEILLKSKDGKLDLSELYETDSGSFWRLSVDNPKGCEIENISDNLDQKNVVVLKENSVRKFLSDNSSQAIDSLVLSEAQSDDLGKSKYTYGDTVTLDDIEVVYSNGEKAEEGLKFHTFNKENKSMENYSVKDGKLSGVKATVGHRMKLGVVTPGNDHTLIHGEERPEYFNYYWFTVSNEGIVKAYDELSNEDLGDLSKITVIKKADLVGEHSDGEKVELKLPLWDLTAKSNITQDKVTFSVTGDGQTREFTSDEDGYLNLDLIKGVKYTINIVRKMDYTYKMNGYSFTVDDSGLAIREGFSDPISRVEVYQGTYMVRIYVFNKGASAEAGIEFEIKEDETGNVQTKAFDGEFLTFDTSILKGYTISLKDNDKYEMEPVHVTMKTHPDDGLYWPIFDEDKIKENDDGKLKALFINKIGEEPSQEIPDNPDGGCGDELCTFYDEKVTTISIPLFEQVDDENKEEIKVEKEINFQLFDSTNQEIVKEFKSIKDENGTHFLPELELIKGNKYIISAKDEVFHMDNMYIRQMNTETKPYNFKDEKEFEDLTLYKKTDSFKGYRCPVEKNAIFNGKAIPGVKFKFISEIETLEATSNENGKVSVDLIEDVTYMVVVEDDKYSIESYPIVIKDKQKGDGWTTFGKFPFDHSSCNYINAFTLIEKANEHKNDTIITCPSGKTKVTGLKFNNLELLGKELEAESIENLKGLDAQLLEFRVINPFRCETSKLASGEFKFTRELGNEKTVSKLYRVNNNGELREIEFTQEGSQIKFTLDSLMIEKIAIVYGSENMPIVKVERTAGDNRYLTAIEVSKKQFDKADTVILANGEDFPDSLAASPLTSIKNAPLLLTSEGENLDLVKKEIEKLGAKNIIIVGGENSVSKTQEEFYSKLGKVERIKGENRYQTALEIAKVVLEANSGQDRVIVALGERHEDALSIGAYAAKEKMAIILTNGTDLSYAKDYLNEKSIKEALVIGGENSVSKKVEENFEKAHRIAGENKYETATKVAEELFPETEKIALVNGNQFSDALVISSLAGKNSMPIILTEQDKLNEKAGKYIKANNIKEVEIFGGINSVSDKLFK